MIKGGLAAKGNKWAARATYILSRYTGTLCRRPINAAPVRTANNTTRLLILEIPSWLSPRLSPSIHDSVVIVISLTTGIEILPEDFKLCRDTCRIQFSFSINVLRFLPRIFELLDSRGRSTPSISSFLSIVDSIAYRHCLSWNKTKVILMLIYLIWEM